MNPYLPAGQPSKGNKTTATKPRGRIARALADRGIRIDPITEDEGNVDRYVLSKRLVVERRTGGGFLKGIMDKTLFTSAIYMREHFEVPLLLVEGQVHYEYSMMDPQAVRGALSSMLLLYEISVVSTSDMDETVDPKRVIAVLASLRETRWTLASGRRLPASGNGPATADAISASQKQRAGLTRIKWSREVSTILSKMAS